MNVEPDHETDDIGLAVNVKTKRVLKRNETFRASHKDAYFYYQYVWVFFHIQKGKLFVYFLGYS